MFMAYSPNQHEHLGKVKRIAQTKMQQAIRKHWRQRYACRVEVRQQGREYYLRVEFTSGISWRVELRASNPFQLIHALSRKIEQLEHKLKTHQGWHSTVLDLRSGPGGRADGFDK